MALRKTIAVYYEIHTKPHFVLDKASYRVANLVISCFY